MTENKTNILLNNMKARKKKNLTDPYGSISEEFDSYEDIFDDLSDFNINDEDDKKFY